MYNVFILFIFIIEFAFNLTNDKKTIMAEAKSEGFNTKAIAHVLKLRKLGQAARMEEQNLFASYEAALGL